MAGRQTRSRASRAQQIDDEIVGLRAVSDAVIYRHVFESADREVGGVLVGRLAVAGRLPLITGAIPAISADEQRATLTFTQDAWAHVHRVLDTEFPADEQIVGWYHSHPGFGIFLSSHDLFIHENFFSAPSQIAVVVDPHARREGVFAWRDDALSPVFERETPSAWTATRPQRPAPSPAGEDAVPRRLTRRPRKGPGAAWPGLLLAGLVGLAIGFGLWSLADGVGGGSSRGGGTPTPTHRAAPASTRAKRASPPVHDDIEVLQR
jgi:proteasome lid subunit RPN8/RPN11